MGRGRGLKTIKDNVEKMKSMLDAYIKTVVTTKLLSIFKITAGKVEGFRDSLSNFPILTGNLADSIGAAIYADGKIVRFMPSMIATEPALGSGYEQWGINELLISIDACYTDYANGLWLVLFSTVEYSNKVNEEGSWAKNPRGKGYFDKMKELVLIDVQEQIAAI